MRRWSMRPTAPTRSGITPALHRRSELFHRPLPLWLCSCAGPERRLWQAHVCTLRQRCHNLPESRHHLGRLSPHSPGTRPGGGDRGSDELRIWLNHFEYHAEHPRRIPADLTDLLTADERRLIASSIATFQLGEQSEGATLLRAAE